MERTDGGERRLEGLEIERCAGVGACLAEQARRSGVAGGLSRFAEGTERNQLAPMTVFWYKKSARRYLPA